MRVTIMTLVGVLVTTPVVAQSDQNGQSPGIGQRLLNGLQNSQTPNRNTRDGNEQDRGYQQERRQPNGESRNYNSRDNRNNGDRGDYGNSSNLSRGNRQDDGNSGRRSDYNDRASGNQNYNRSDRGQD